MNDILDSSKIENGKLEIIPVEYELSSLVNDVLNMLGKRAADKGLDFVVDVDEKMPHLLYGDDVRIKQCILNILTNAVKYTPAGSVTMSLSAKKLGAKSIALTVHVKDTGIGIKEEDLPKLFTAYQRIEEKRNRKVEGTGLGVNIVQNLLELMGSRLEVQSVYGKGSDFYFTLEQGVVSWESIGNFGERHKAAMAENTEEYHESFHAPDAQILVVDDTKLNLTVIRGLLKKTQVQIDTAESGNEALVKITEKKYDCILLDHRMPGMDGIQTLHAMPNVQGNLCSGVPVIALTATATPDAREMYLAEGFTDYLTKPVDGAEIERLLAEYLPQNLLVRRGEAGFVETPAWDGVERRKNSAGTCGENAAVADAFCERLFGIRVADAVKACGSTDVLLDAVRDFYDAIDDKSDLIGLYADERDWKNYTVLVHALKSSARLIGAAELSALAAELEATGDAQDEAVLLQKTPELLEQYRSYRAKLAPLVPGANSAADGDSREPLDEAAYAEALGSLRECVSVFDFDTADSIITMLSGYALPPERRDHFARLKKAVSAVDAAAVQELL